MDIDGGNVKYDITIFVFVSLLCSLPYSFYGAYILV